MKKLLSVLLTLSLFLLLATGCAPATTGTPSAPPSKAPTSQTSAAPQTGEPAADTGIKVAMLLSGYINDAGWNQSSFEGMALAEKEFGVTSSYSEAVAQPDFESTMRDYADQGFDLVICVGNEFSDAALKVAPTFPDTKFAVMNGNECLEPNVGAFRFNTPETGFLAGALAASYSTAGIVGVIGGTTLPHIKDASDAFAVGAAYINPEIKVLSNFTESMTDIAKGKEMGMAFVEQGADVLNANANSCSLGVIDAAKEKGIRHIGYISDQYDVAPETVMVSVVQSNQFMIKAIIQSVVEDTYTPTLHLYGMAEGAIYLSDYHGHDDKITAEQKAKIDEIVAGTIDGSLKAQGILPKSIFEQ